MYYRHNNGDTPFVFIALLIGLIIVLYIIDNIISDNQYNNGICSCGGTFQYEQAVGHRYETRYLYICDKCGRAIEISNYYPPK